MAHPRNLLDVLRLDRAPLALPGWLDQATEWLAGLRPRQRQVLAALACLAVFFGLVRPRPHPWGEVTSVVVLRRTLDAGEVITTADVEMRPWPALLAPPSPVANPAAAAGRRLAARTLAGSVLDASQLAVTSPADRAPPGWGAVPIARDRLPLLDPGTVLDVHGGNGRSVTGAIVLEVGATQVWLAVPRGRVADLAAALDWGEVHVAIWATADQSATD